MVVAGVCAPVKGRLQTKATQSVAESAMKETWISLPPVVECGREASRPAKVATWRAFEVPWGHVSSLAIM